MTEDQVYAILERIPWVGQISRSGDWHLTCRCLMGHRHAKGYDSTPSMTVSFDVPAPWVECFSCGFKQPLEKTLFTLAASGKIDAELPLMFREMKLATVDFTFDRPKTIAINDYTIPLDHLRKNPYPDDMVSFLKTKGVSEVAAKAFRLAYVPEGHADEWMGEDREGNPRVVKNRGICLPIYTKQSGAYICVGAQMRFLEGNLKYYSLYKFNASRRLFGEQLLGKAKDCDVFLVEGSFDAIHLCSLGFRAVANLGTSFNEHKALLLKSAEPKRVHLFFDPDKAGILGAKKAEPILKEYGIPYQAHTPDKDPKKYLKEELTNLVNS